MVEESSETIAVRSHGAWSVADAERYVQQFGSAVQDARHRFGRVKILVDARDAVRHPPHIAIRLAYLGRLLLPCDRFAVVLRDSIRKQETRPSLPATGTPFMSIEAARIWLSAADG